MEKAQHYDETNWATPGMKEARYWRDGMTVEEFDIEEAYSLAECSMGSDHRDSYCPLWQQKIKNNPDYEENYEKALKYRKMLFGY